MSKSDQWAERIGRTINELDIDFHRFTLAGWSTVVASLTLGVVSGWSIYHVVPHRGPMDKGPALLCGVGGFVVAMTVFFAMRWVYSRFQIAIVSSNDNDTDSRDRDADLRD
ncbi:MAG: hypothetical protein HKN47_17865 [Pirellulaceae bacterium]|nr:hypothetical protein [Pirellulaceae bacterium]